jgi:hypothetical protein
MIIGDSFLIIVTELLIGGGWKKNTRHGVNGDDY